MSNARADKNLRRRFVWNSELMGRNLLWFAGGAVSLVMVAGFGGLVFLKMGADGFSARSKPSFLEASAARQRANPIAKSKVFLDDAMAHWADHCAVCHGNDGSGQVDMGRQMYPPAPDMRKQPTQALTDGELFYIIENGVRLSGMPAWGGSTAAEQDSWKLLHFIRHLPQLSSTEIAQMEKLNPKGPDDIEQEREQQEFLNWQTPKAEPKEHRH